MKAMVGLLPVQGELTVMGIRPREDRAALLTQLSYIPDVAVLPRWARVAELIELMARLQPQFKAPSGRASCCAARACS